MNDSEDADVPDDAAIAPEAIAAALALAGTWSDLDWDDVLECLDRIRHDSVPTLPSDDV